MRLFAISLALATGLSAACTDAPDGDGTECTGKCDADGDTDTGPSLCVAIRGNGQRLTAHFGALARIIEHYGLIDASAGGSSGSISSFLLESVQKNPLVYDCGGRSCTADERADRAAFLFKSMVGYFDALGRTDEVQSVLVLADLAGRVQDRGIPALLDNDPEVGVDALRTLLESDDVRDLVNPEVFELLATSPDPAYHARDLVAALSGALEFRADDPTIFVRPGIVDFDAIADKLGRVASFYAGYEPLDRGAMSELLDDCAGPGRGLEWPSIAPMSSGDSTCGARFGALVDDFRADVLARPGAYRSRADDAVGADLRVLITTSVLDDEAVSAFQAARDDYRNARPVELDVDFDDVGFGYWGRREDLERVASNPRGFTDAKTARFRSLGPARWRDVLAYSPAEPGLTRALELPDGRVSAGGWSDLQPVLVLENLGCDRVVYVTRRGSDSTFMLGVAGLLGMTEADRLALFDLASPDSALYRSIEESAAVWCTDWDAPDAFDIPAMFADGYNAPMESTDPALTGDGAYANVSSELGLAGCTPGVH